MDFEADFKPNKRTVPLRACARDVSLWIGLILIWVFGMINPPRIPKGAVIEHPDPPDTSKIHNLITKCLRESGSPYKLGDLEHKPRHERERHYKELLKSTEAYWSLPPHTFTGFKGPWMEGLYRDFFKNQPFESFGPVIPLFHQWQSIYYFAGWNASYSYEVNASMNILRPDFLYATVTMHDYGLIGEYNIKPTLAPNLFIAAGNGAAHMPTLLPKKELPVQAMPESKYRVGFVGRVRGVRKNITDAFKEEFGSQFYIGNVKKWEEKYRSCMVGLSPRGIGRGCFRTMELLQMGVIPAIVYDDYPWIPYLNSSLPLEDIMFISDIPGIPALTKKIKALTPQRVEFMRATIRKYRESHFTNSGMMNQLLMFYKYGYEKSDLRCDKYYPEL